MRREILSSHVAPSFFPIWQQNQFLAPALEPPKTSRLSTEMIEESEASTSGASASEAMNKSRARNWMDIEIRYLLTVWKDHFPVSKRNNSSAWENIAKELNQLLKDQGLSSFRTGSQCKSKIKNLEDEFKRVKDHNNKSGNNRESFAYFDDMNEVLGCRPKISPKIVVECGFEESSPGFNKTSSGGTPKESSDEEEASEEVNGDLSFSESLFCKPRNDSSKKRKNLGGLSTSKKTPPSKRPKKKRGRKCQK